MRFSKQNCNKNMRHLLRISYFIHDLSHGCRTKNQLSPLGALIETRRCSLKIFEDSSSMKCARILRYPHIKYKRNRYLCKIKVKWR
jgi:hypothetical protein